MHRLQLSESVAQILTLPGAAVALEIGAEVPMPGAVALESNLQDRTPSDANMALAHCARFIAQKAELTAMPDAA